MKSLFLKRCDYPFFRQRLRNAVMLPSLMCISLVWSAIWPAAVLSTTATFQKVEEDSLGSFTLQGNRFNRFDKQDPSWREGTVELLTITHKNGGHSQPVRAVVFHPESRFFATGGANEDIKIWDLEGRSRVKVFMQDSEVLSLAFSSDGRYLASGSLDGTIRIWDWRMGELKHTIKEHGGLVTDVEFTPDSRELVSGSSDRTVKIWDVETGRNTAGIETSQLVQSVAIDQQNSQRIATTGLGREINLWDRQTNRQRSLAERFSNAIYSLAWHPSGQQLAFSPNSSTLTTSVQQNNIALLDVEKGRVQVLSGNHTDYVSFVAYSPSGETLLSGSWDKTIKLWNTRTGEFIREFLENDQRILSGSFSADGQSFVIGSGNGTIKIYSSRTSQ